MEIIGELTAWWQGLGLWWQSIMAVFWSVYAVWPVLLGSHLLVYVLGWRFGWKGLLVVTTLGVGWLFITRGKPDPYPSEIGNDYMPNYPKPRKTARRGPKSPPKSLIGD
jgi:hypothetical protein